jgi:hypothetical protein
MNDARSIADIVINVVTTIVSQNGGRFLMSSSRQTVEIAIGTEEGFCQVDYVTAKDWTYKYMVSLHVDGSQRPISTPPQVAMVSTIPGSNHHHQQQQQQKQQLRPVPQSGNSPNILKETATTTATAAPTTKSNEDNETVSSTKQVSLPNEKDAVIPTIFMMDTDPKNDHGVRNSEKEEEEEERMSQIGRQQQEKQQRQNSGRQRWEKQYFLLHVRCLIKYLKWKDQDLCEKVKAVVEVCGTRKQLNNDSAANFSLSPMRLLLMDLVGEFHWNKSVRT